VSCVCERERETEVKKGDFGCFVAEARRAHGFSGVSL
jgi:hypothetical protein